MKILARMHSRSTAQPAALIGLSVALALFPTSFVSEEHRDFRAIGVDGRVMHDHAGHRMG